MQADAVMQMISINHVFLSKGEFIGKPGGDMFRTNWK
jgi:hypothetical protein